MNSYHITWQLTLEKDSHLRRIFPPAAWSIIANLHFILQLEKDAELIISRKKSYYNHKDKWWLKGVTYIKSIRAQDFLVENDWVTLQKGYYGYEGEGLRSTLKPTEKLIKLLNNKDETYKSLSHVHSVFIRKKKSKILPPANPLQHYKECCVVDKLRGQACCLTLSRNVLEEELRRTKKELTEEQRKYRQCSSFRFNGPIRHFTEKLHRLRLRTLLLKNLLSDPSETIEIPQEDLTYTRIYNDEKMESGGRLYCALQRLPGRIRRLLEARGEKMVELDYNATNLSLIYAAEGIQIEKDPYVLPGFSREAMKLVALIIVTCKSAEVALRSIQNQVRKGKLSLEGKSPAEAILAFSEAHQKISKHFYSEGWKWLQKLDSDIALEIMLELTRQKIPYLAVHDSFLVPESKKEQLEQLMIDTWQKHTQKLPGIKEETNESF